MATDASNRIVTLRKLGIALSMLAAGAPAQARGEQTADVQRTLEQLHAMTSNLAVSDQQHLSRIREIERQIDAAFARIEMAATAEQCAEHGMAYIATATGALLSSIEFEIGSEMGFQHISFVSGTTIVDLVAAINSMQQTTGVTAAASNENPKMVELRAMVAGPHHFVRIVQHSGKTPVIHAFPFGGKGMYSWTDYGCAIGVPVCAAPASLYLSTSHNLDNDGNGSTTLFVMGVNGHQVFTFASGTTQMNIVAALNTFMNVTGIHAVQCPENSERIQLSSILVGEPAFVSVAQVGGTTPIVYATPQSGTPTYSLITHGLDRLAGDVNCDRIVNVVDLMLVVQDWGECPLPPFACEADLTNDGHVNVQDLLSVLNNWGAMG